MTRTLLALAAVVAMPGLAAAQGPVAGAPSASAKPCPAAPPFVASLGFSPNAALTTSDVRRKGLLLIEPQGTQGREPFQHPSWAQAGALGPIARDRAGNVYTVPVPRIDVWDNPIDRQSRLLVVDGETAKMRELLPLPFARPPSGRNPFAAMGLAYDCAQHALYVTTVTGSSRDEELGRVYRIDLAANPPAITHTLEGVDAIGVTIFDGPDGKQLLLGRARVPEIHAVKLDAAGGFAGPPVRVASIADWDAVRDERARRIDVLPNREVVVRTTPFRFNLAHPRDSTHNAYRINVDPSGTWRLLETSRGPG